MLPPATPAPPSTPAPQAAAAAPAAYDSGRLAAFLAMRATHPEVSDAVLLAFRAAEYRGAGQGDYHRGGTGGGGLRSEIDSHYGPGVGDERQCTHQPAQHHQLHPWQGNGGAGSSGGWAGGRGSRHCRYGGGAHDSAGEGVVVPTTRSNLPDTASPHNHQPHAQETTYHVAAAPRPDTGDVNRQLEELSRTPDRQVIQRAFARLATRILITVPPLPFALGHVPDLVHLTPALRKSVDLARVACGDTHTADWTRGWEKVLERQVLRSVRASCPQAAGVKTMVVGVFVQGGKLLDAEQSGQTAFDHILRAFCRGLSEASPAAVMQGVKFIFTPEHTNIVQALLEQLASAEVLAFPDFPAAIAGDRPFQLITDASVDGLGAAVEQEQADGMTRAISSVSRSTPPNERNWSATKLQCAALV